MITITLPEYLAVLFVISGGLYILQNLLELYAWYLRRKIEKLKRGSDD